MKKIIILSLLILGVIFSQTTHANVDTVGIAYFEEHCNSKEAGNNLLEIHFGTIGHHSDVRWYRLPFLNSGHISIGDGYNTTLVNKKINGCGCPTTPVGAGSYPAFWGWQIQLEHGQGINYFRSKEYWPYTSGPWAYDDGTRCDGGGCIPPTGSLYNVVSIPWDAGFTTAWFANTTTTVNFTPEANGGVSTNPGCYPASCGPANTAELKSIPLTAGSAGLCAAGSSSAFTESIDATGITHYGWTCQQAGGIATSCTSAQYKPLCIPTATDGCCTETRNASQCIYSVKDVDKAQPTQDGPLTLSFLKSSADMNNIASECRPPVDGKPRVVCDANPLINISSTLTSFTLPSSVTQAQGNCKVIFDSVDTCAPNKGSEDTITFKGVPVKCDPLTPDCVSIEEKKVCIKLKDKFGNIVTKDANQVTITTDGAKNTYITADTTQYSLGEVTLVDGNFCVPIGPPVCVTGEPNCPPKVCIPGEVGCPKPCVPGEPDCTPPPVCTPGEPGCTTTCIPGSRDCPTVIVDDWCMPGMPGCPGTFTFNPITVGIGNPGGSSFTYTPADMGTLPSGGVFIRKKSCTGHLEVLDGETWSTDGVLYDTDQLYRVVVDGESAACVGGSLSFNGISAMTGSVNVDDIRFSPIGTFVAKITKPANATERTSRGVSVSLMYTEPSGGIRYGLTSSDSDFTDSPLLIAGDRMKGVRILGNTLGSNMSIFNHNNRNAIAEQTALITESRNAMIKNINLLTRGMTDARIAGGKVINGILYVEGDLVYSDILGRDFQTLVVKGGDLIIDSDIGSGGISGPKGIIVLRGDISDAGNIIIAGGVTFIHASIFAEGTLRGSSDTTSVKNRDLQLVLKGSIFSRNTIGGSADPAALYTSGNAVTTSLDDAFIQDLNHVRSGNGGSKYKGYIDPFIIDYDNMQGSPLPGFSN